MKEYVSIFNDVLGPVMIGPSSSHTAASVRIGRTLRQMIQGEIVSFEAAFDPKGSLAATYHTQCSDVGLIGGLLEMEPTDERLLQSIELAEERGIKVDFLVVPYENTHPNTYRMKVKNKAGEELNVTALSVGGGMMEIIKVNGYDLLMTGGYYETLLFGKLSASEEELHQVLQKTTGFCKMDQKKKDETLLVIKTLMPLTKVEKDRIGKVFSIKKIIETQPVLPVKSQQIPNVPFHNAKEMLELGEKENLELWELAVYYESVRGGISETEVFEKMLQIVEIMEGGIQKGLAGTKYNNRILGYQSHQIYEHKERLIGGTLVADIIAYISAMMEVKSSMGVFVAAPTAGSCGALPGTVFAVAKHLKKSKEDITKAMLAAGIIGVFIAEYATFAAEVAGCQAECGSGSGMTAGALVQLNGGTASEAVNAASMALQNIFGMVCDPVANGVEVPCLGKNMMCGMNALGAANMALADFDVVVPLDETIRSFNEVGRMIPSELRCTGKAGLATTPTGEKIRSRMNQGCSGNCCS